MSEQANEAEGRNWGQIIDNLRAEHQATRLVAALILAELVRRDPSAPGLKAMERFLDSVPTAPEDGEKNESYLHMELHFQKSLTAVFSMAREFQALFDDVDGA